MEVERKLHQTILKVTDDYYAYRLNTAIAAMMEFNNVLMRAKENGVHGSPIWDEAVRSLVLMMAPIFPHISEELWHRLGNESSVHVAKWPTGDEEKAREDELTIVVQVNGKVRDKLVKAPGVAKDVLENEALALPNIMRWTEDKTVRKVIVVPDKLVNIVVG